MRRPTVQRRGLVAALHSLQILLLVVVVALSQHVADVNATSKHAAAVSLNEGGFIFPFDAFTPLPASLSAPPKLLPGGGGAPRRRKKQQQQQQASRTISSHSTAAAGHAHHVVNSNCLIPVPKVMKLPGECVRLQGGQSACVSFRGNFLDPSNVECE